MKVSSSLGPLNDLINPSKGLIGYAPASHDQLGHPLCLFFVLGVLLSSSQQPQCKVLDLNSVITFFNFAISLINYHVS